MTCIAGAIKDGEVCIGGDGVSIQPSSSARPLAAGKVFKLGEFLIGASGTVRAEQIFRYLFEPPSISGDLQSYMVRHFVPVLRALMKEHGGECKTEDGDEELNARYLVGVRGRLFEIDSAYGAFESHLPYAAVGSADQEALAAMFTALAMDSGVSAEEIVRRGLAAAAEFNTDIRPPFTVMTLTRAEWQ